MRTFTILSALLVFLLATSCADGHKNQTWAPRSGKPMKRGMNNGH